MTRSASLECPDPDAALVRDLKAGGPGADRAFARLVARHGPTLRRRAARILGDDAEAEDVVQDVFTNVHRFLDRFSPDRPFRHWLSVVTLNACRVELRRRTARTRRHDAFGADPLRPTSTATGGDPLLRDALREAFAALDVRTRDCIGLRVLEGLSYQEIAARCGQSEAAVKMRVLRGLRELRARHPGFAEAEAARASA
jgi:RNA polymerase sigma factor (sigma-70 family)